MDKVTRMLLKAKQMQGNQQGNKFIQWGLLFPRPEGWELTICYTGGKPNDKLVFKTEQEADEFIDKLADEHGQYEVMVIKFKADPNGRA